MDVLVIGAAGSDTKGRITGPSRTGISNSGLVRLGVGGVARNIADNLARLGVEVALISAVGQDWVGQYVLEQAQQVGVDVSNVLVQPDLRTGAYLALRDERGGLVIALDDMAAMEAVTPRYLNDRRRLFREARMVVVDANLTPAALETVFRLAGQHNCPVCADPTSSPLASRLRPFLRQLHLVAPNLEEAQALLGPLTEADVEAAPVTVARRLVAEGVAFAVVTLAERGLCYATPEETGHLPAIDVPIVDRTGAGDALTAAVIFGLLEGLTPSEAVRLGLSAAALTLQCRETVCPDLGLEKLYGQLVV